MEPTENHHDTSTPQTSAVGELKNMFPDVDIEVISTLLDANEFGLQKTIDSLLQISTITNGEGKIESTLSLEEKSPQNSIGGEEGTIQDNKIANTVDDELLARSLQTQLVGDSQLDDERLAAEIVRMENDEILARQLQRQEMSGYPSRNNPNYIRRSGPMTWPDPDNIYDSDSDSQRLSKLEEPLGTQIDKKLSEIGQDLKIGWAQFTSKLSKVFQVSPETSNISTPTVPPASEVKYTPVFDKDLEENDLLSSDEEEEPDEEDTKLIDKRIESKNVVLTINTDD